MVSSDLQKKLPYDDVKVGDFKLGIIKTKSGVEFDSSSQHWVYRDETFDINLNFSKITGCSADFIHQLKYLLKWYAVNLSAYSLRNTFERLKSLISYTRASVGENLEVISSGHLLAFSASLPKNDGTLSALSAVVKRSVEFGLTIFSKDAAALFEQKTFRGNDKGVAVATLCPYFGPFSNVEYEAILSKVRDEYARGFFSEYQITLVLLFLVFGQRPVQYAALKICDFKVRRDDAGNVEYSIDIPSAKTPNSLRRGRFKNRVLTESIGKIVLLHINQVKKQFHGLLSDLSQLPMFPQLETKHEFSAGFEFHRTSAYILNDLKKALDPLNIFSERTGDYINITGRRFRYTVGTRAAGEGHGQLIIAELLDHTDTQNVLVYVQNSPEMLARIDRAMAMSLAPLAQAFAGTLVTGAADAVRGEDPKSLIADPKFDGSFKPMGNCGNFNFCGLAAPIACYTCRNFQPWIDGPHESVLQHLLADRDRLTGGKFDPTIVVVNDRTIFAVARVIQLCDALKNKRVAKEEI